MRISDWSSDVCSSDLIIDARIHTTRDGMALDNFLVQDPFGRPFDHPDQLARLETSIEDAFANRTRLADRLKAKPLPPARAEAFETAPNVIIDNDASRSDARREGKEGVSTCSSGGSPYQKKK